MRTKKQTEREITFDGTVAGDLTAARPDGVARAEEAESEILDALYFDTPDHSLLRHGATLRRRAGGHDAGWHLKLPAEGGGRREITRSLDGDGDGQGRGDGGSAGEVPAELRQLACAYARGGDLRPVAHLLTHRRRVLWRDRKKHTLAELAADHVAARVLNGKTTDADARGPETELTVWDETEVELKNGDAGLLDAAARKLTESGLRPAEGGIKLGRALRAAGVDVTPLSRAELSGAGRTAAAVVAALRQHADRLVGLDPEVRLDEPDAVHQMRVTARRLRSVLRACGPLFDADRADELAADLRRLGHQLGAYREPEALRERLTAQARDLPDDCRPRRAERKLRKVLDRRCRHAHLDIVAALSSAWYFGLLDRLEDFVADPPLRAGQHPGGGRARRILRHETRRTKRRLRKAIKLPAGPRQDEALHGARKAAKRTRYLAGALQPVLASKAEKQEARHKKIHKRLGRHQDARSAEQALTDLGQTEGTRADEAFAFGVLRTRQRDGSAGDIRAARRAAGL